jgi:hypothetical protein
MKKEFNIHIPASCRVLIEKAVKGDSVALNAIREDIVNEVSMSYQIRQGDEYVGRRNQISHWTELAYLSEKPELIQGLVSQGLLDELLPSFTNETFVQTVMQYNDWKTLGVCLKHMYAGERWENRIWAKFAQELFGRYDSQMQEECWEQLSAPPLEVASEAIAALCERANQSKAEARRVERVLSPLSSILCSLWARQEEMQKPHFKFLNKHIQWAKKASVWVGKAEEVVYHTPWRGAQVWDSMMAFAEKAGCLDDIKAEMSDAIDRLDKETLESILNESSNKKGGHAMAWAALLHERTRLSFLPQRVTEEQEDGLIKALFHLEHFLAQGGEGDDVCRLKSVDQKELIRILTDYKAKHLPQVEWDNVWQEAVDEGEVDERVALRWKALVKPGLSTTRKLNAL